MGRTYPRDADGLSAEVEGLLKRRENGETVVIPAEKMKKYKSRKDSLRKTQELNVAKALDKAEKPMTAAQIHMIDMAKKKAERDKKRERERRADYFAGTAAPNVVSVIEKHDSGMRKRYEEKKERLDELRTWEIKNALDDDEYDELETFRVGEKVRRQDDPPRVRDSRAYTEQMLAAARMNSALRKMQKKLDDVEEDEVMLHQDLPKRKRRPPPKLYNDDPTPLNRVWVHNTIPMKKPSATPTPPPPPPSSHAETLNRIYMDASKGWTSGVRGQEQRFERQAKGECQGCGRRDHLWKWCPGRKESYEKWAKGTEL